MLQIKTPERIQSLLNELTLSPKERKALHIELAKDTRNFFRGQIRQQRDIHGTPYAPRRRRKPMYMLYGQKVFRQNLDQRRNMLTGLSRMLMTKADESGFSVGLAGLPGKIAEIHNDGQAVKYVARMHGWFNSKTNRWEGGRKSHQAYHMPKRTFIGWTKELEMQIAHKIYQRMELES